MPVLAGVDGQLLAAELAPRPAGVEGVLEDVVTRAGGVDTVKEIHGCSCCEVLGFPDGLLTLPARAVAMPPAPE